MNRYPLWKYLVVLVALVIGILYTLPNFFGESPAVQVAAAKSTVKVDSATLSEVDRVLEQNQLQPTGSFVEHIDTSTTARYRFSNTDDQLRAKDLIEQALNPDAANAEYTVALNLLPASPNWLTKIGALPMHLGLDLRGGVHFLLQVDMDGALSTRYDTLTTELRTVLRQQKLPVEQVERQQNRIYANFNTADERDAALTELRRQMPELSFSATPGQPELTAQLSDTAIAEIEAAAVEQNITTLRNRINELGVSEPVIQRQGADRIVVQLPGVQDVARAKEILGRTASLEIRLVDDSPSAMAALSSGKVPFGVERFYDTSGAPLLLRRQVLLTGENLEKASAGRDTQANVPAVHLQLDSKGARIFRDVTRDNINRRMAIVLYEQGVGTVITAPVIRTEIPNGQVQITGSMNARDAADIALLLRSGSLAAPMEIIEERTIGPSLGAANIEQGFNSTLYGFIAIAIFIIIYYQLFGLFSTLGLSFNILLLIAVLSMLQATLTLPGIAALALTIGMAIDANVLINERIREEMRNGASPQQAIHLGFDRAWATIFDSNLTSLIVGIALLTYGDGPIRGFAVVHCIGILTSMFTSVVGVRAMVNLWYGKRRRLNTIAIGQVWKPQDEQKS
ncbi:MAG TPA: protein translocase subunit SecD [Candidatus Paenalcaligenes intestinipullorum]|uniref:Protein translocase subunit SecD n=1 Tax=Candidatus Paenalcaligenes intestinipullorum TaxID=2838718 RepID=A0A9D2U7Y6_9BURK|nr:protein translocase subunit SecD [Candidatus Paenalcaligenes intestinipullorum]